MRLPIVATRAHLGKSLDLDCDRETITLVGPSGEELATLSWELLIDQLLAQDPPKPEQETRSEERVALSFKVRYRTPEGHVFESRARGIGGGGLYIESDAPLPVGTSLSMDFVLQGATNETLEAKGTVAWICPKSDQYTFSSGMGIQFTDMTPDTRGRILKVMRDYQCSE